MTLTTGTDLIAEERQRQVEVEEYTVEHDDDHSGAELSGAAACYLDAAIQMLGGTRLPPIDKDWPWDAESFKPSDDPIRNLVIAGALIAAEIDRLLRAKDAAGR